MKIAILGGNGFIGSNLSIYLKNKFKNIDIISVDNNSGKGSKFNQKRLTDYKIKILKKNLSKKNSLDNVGKIDIFINCCSDPTVENSKKKNSDVVDNNFLTTLNMLNHAVKFKSKIIYFSTSRVYSIESINKLINNRNLKNKVTVRKKINENFNTSGIRTIYGLTKLFSEEIIKEFSYLHNLKYIINRCGIITGPWQFGKKEQGLFSFWMKKHITKKPIKFIGYGGYGNQVRDALHIDDLNLLIFKQIKKINKVNNITFNVGGGLKNTISLKDLTKKCEKITGNSCLKTKIKKTSNYDIPYYVTDNNKVSKTYNWKPLKNINVILKDIYYWMLKNKNLLSKF